MAEAHPPRGRRRAVGVHGGRAAEAGVLAVHAPLLVQAVRERADALGRVDDVDLAARDADGREHVARALAPREDGAPVLDARAEDEPEEDVHAAESEEEEGGDERERADVVREHRRADAAWAKRGSCEGHGRDRMRVRTSTG